MPTKKFPANPIVSTDDAATLTGERKTTHGNFEDVSRYTQQIKRVIAEGVGEREDRGQPPLTNQQRESLEMIAHKMGRIIAGNASFDDHWDDIKGYAHIANRRQGE